MPPISYNVLTCILEDPVLMCCRLARNRLLRSTSMLTAAQSRSTSIPKKANLPFSSLVLLPALGWGSNVTAVCESHLVNGLVGGDGIDKLAFAWKCFLF